MSFVSVILSGLFWFFFSSPLKSGSSNTSGRAKKTHTVADSPGSGDNTCSHTQEPVQVH